MSSSPAPVDLSEVAELLQKVVAFDQEGDHESALGALFQVTDLVDTMKFRQAQRREALNACPGTTRG